MGRGRLLWRLSRAAEVDPVSEGRRLFAGDAGRRLDEAGIMLALTDAEGRLHAATARHVIDWRWVKGHSGDPDNERVDQLARDEAIRFKGMAAQ